MIEIKKVEQPEEIQAVRYILESYAAIRNYDVALGDYKSEISNLPGKYAYPGGCLLIATENRTPIGMVAFRRFNMETCEMKRMFVLPEYRGRKCGKLMLNALIKCAREQGYMRMYLDTHPWMKTAQLLYSTLGFKEVEAYHFNPTKGIRFFELRLR